MDKDKHEMPDLDDTFGAKVKKGARKQKQTGVIFGADNKVISRVEHPDSRSLPPDPEDR